MYPDIRLDSSLKRIFVYHPLVLYQEVMVYVASYYEIRYLRI